MKKVHYAVILVLVLTSLIIGGCTRSATKGGGGGGIATNTPAIPFPVGPTSNPNRMTEIVSATQTAAILPTQAPEQNTPESGGGVEQPVPTAVDEAPLAPTTQPTAKSAIIFATSTPGIPSTYVVQPGEFPYCLARRFDVNPADLLAANGISGNVSPGTTLTIPSNSKWPADFERSLRSHPTDYTVQSGQTIYEIACLFGDADPNDIIAANGLSAPYTLTSGQVIHVP